MSKNTKKNLILSLLLLVLAAAALIYMLTVVDAKSQQLKDSLEVIAERQAQESSQLRLQRTAEESAADREKLANYFFRQEGDSIYFLNLVETYARKMNVHYETKDLEPITDPKTNAALVAINFTYSGTYKDVTTFTQVLENLPYVSEIQSLSLQARSSTDWLATATMLVNMYTYDEGN